METRDWGRGVPEFYGQDIMTEDEIRRYGVEAVLSYLCENGYEVINALAEKDIWPNIIAKKDGRLWFVAAVTDIAPNTGDMPQSGRENLLAHAMKYNAVAAVACLSIGSADAERFDISLALRNDKYMVNFSSFEILNN